MRRRGGGVAGLLRAESKFRRVKGHRAMTALLKALEGWRDRPGRDRLEPDAASCKNGRQSRLLTMASGRAREGSWAESIGFSCRARGAPYVRPIRPGRPECRPSRPVLCRARFRSPDGRLRT